MSTHAVKVVKVGKIDNHPNADRLSVTVIDGWQVVIRTADFKEGDIAVYIPPDYVLPCSLKLFDFLTDGERPYRLRASKFRGVVSFGLLIPLPDSLRGRNVGDNVMHDLLIYRYDPPLKGYKNGESLSVKDGPVILTGKYDLENFKHAEADGLLPRPMRGYITEKIHGTNARYIYCPDKKRFFAGSRNLWLKDDTAKISLWHRVAAENPGIEYLCRKYENHVFIGEIYGPRVQNLSYGLKNDQVGFRVFAIFNNSTWKYLRFKEVADIINRDGHSFDPPVMKVPVLHYGVFDSKRVQALAEINSSLNYHNDPAHPGQLSEGVVVHFDDVTPDGQPAEPPLKYVSTRYWLAS